MPVETKVAELAFTEDEICSECGRPLRNHFHHHEH